MSFIINATNTSGNTGTLEPDVGFSYTDSLNRINKATLKFSGLGAIRKGLLEVGSEIEIKRNGTREFYGLVRDINFLAGGAVVANVDGFEIWLGIEDGAYASSPYTLTASATIAADIIGESTKFTAGTVEAGTNIDFRAQNTDNLYTALTNLTRKTQQDIGIDYANFEVDVLDHKGSSTSVATLNAGIEISNVRIDQFFPKANVVRILGKSEGQTKVCATCCDASSISTFGRISMTIRDRTITTNAEAGKLGAAELAINKQIIKIYDFDMNNFGLNVVSGDVLTLNAQSQGISSESVRTVGVERGIQGDEEFMTLQVTNTEYSRSVKRRNEILGEIEKISRQNEDYEQYETEYSNQTCPTLIAGHIANATCLGDVATTTIIGCRGAFGTVPVAGFALTVTGFSIFGGQVQINTGGMCLNFGNICCVGNLATTTLCATSCAGIGTTPQVGVDIKTVIGCASSCWRAPRICGTTCVRGAVVCATSAFTTGGSLTVVGLGTLGCVCGLLCVVTPVICASAAGNNRICMDIGDDVLICADDDIRLCTSITSSNFTCVNCFRILGSNKTAAIEYEPNKVAYLKVEESPEVWFNDKGTSKMCNCYSKIDFDGIFQKVTESGTDYNIQITSIGKQANLYVSCKHEDGFEVCADKDTDFDWTVSKIRKGMENLRWDVEETHPLKINKNYTDPLNTYEVYQ